MRAAIRNRSKWPGGARDLAGTRQLLGTSTKDVKSFAKRGWQTYLGLEGLGEMVGEPLPVESVQEDTSAQIIPIEGKGSAFPGGFEEKVEETEIINKNNDDDVVITDGSEGNAAAAGVATVAATKTAIPTHPPRVPSSAVSRTVTKPRTNGCSRYMP